jgi:hypothetical protein
MQEQITTLHTAPRRRKLPRPFRACHLAGEVAGPEHPLRSQTGSTPCSKQWRTPPDTAKQGHPRAQCRANERRWCLEGKPPQPGSRPGHGD